MNDPFEHFKQYRIEFQVYRNSQHIATLKGLKNTENGTHRKYVGFDPGFDFQIGDILENSNIKYYVTDLDTQTWQGEIAAIKAYYQTTPPTNTSNSSTIYNIQNATNSIIGNQQSVILNNSSFNMEDLKQLIELYGQEDKQQLYELTSVLQQCLQKNDLKQGKLSKFGSLIAKHSWLPLGIGKIITDHLWK